MKKRVIFDFETRSKCDLRKAGAYKYSLDPSTQPTCMAFKVVGETKTHLLKFEEINSPWRDLPSKVQMIWMDFLGQRFEFTAHNAFFERCIYTNILVERLGWPKLPLRLYRCTAAKAAACALPRNLQGAGEAMRLNVQKDRRGYIAMMATCKPTRAWKKWNDRLQKVKHGRVTRKTFEAAIHEKEPKMFLDYRDAPDVWETLYRYCKIDVEAEEALDNALPDLSEEEQEIWFLNQQINWRGLRIDIPTVEKIVGMMAVEEKQKLQELDVLTMGLVTKPGARRSILEFLAIEGVELPNLQAKTIDDKLSSGDLSANMQRLLQIRRALTMTSTKKYHVFLNRAGEDHRVRDLLLYHGASTGRDSGTGIQPQNSPKGLLAVDEENPYAIIDCVAENDPEMLRLFYGSSLGVLFSSILRNMILPSPGCELFVADYRMVEVAVLWWLADNKPGLEILRSGKDPYKYMAAANTGKRYEDIPSKGNERQLGKAQVLGCGFGMGGENFQATAWKFYRLALSLEQSKEAVLSYRVANPAVPVLWKAYENAAVGAVECRGKRFNAGRCTFHVEDSFLWITLPSGRKIAYRDPQVAWREGEWGPRKTLEFWGVHPLTKKWALEKTYGAKIAENATQAVARDLIMPGMRRADAAGYRALLTVHDELLAERRRGEGTVAEFTRILCETPSWGKGIPIAADGWVGKRYRK